MLPATLTNTNKQKGRRFRLPLLCLTLLILLSGCLSPEDLMQAPRFAPQYRQLQNLINVLLSEGLMYSAPTGGDYRSPVEMKDLNNDGREEAIVFLRGETSHQMVVFLPSGNTYTPLTPTIANADTVRRIAFHDFTGDGELEIVVGWSLSSLRSVSVYTLAGDMVTEILSEQYTDFVVYDEEKSEQSALFIVKMRTVESNAAEPNATSIIGAAELFAYRDEKMSMLAAADLSTGAVSVLRVRTTPLTDGKPGFLVTSQYKISDETNGEITDIFTYRNDDGNNRLVNITRNMETGISNALVRSISVTADDIDGDGVLDLPLPLPLQSHPEADETAFYEIHWKAYDSNGASVETARTYYNFDNARKWFLLLPEKWPEHYTVRWNVVSTSQVITTFSVLLQDGSAIDFLSIDYLSHTADYQQQTQNRIVLLDETLLSVTAELFPFKGDLAEYNINQEELRSMFHMIPISWGGRV